MIPHLLIFLFAVPLAGEDVALLQLEDRGDPAEQGHSVGGCNMWPSSGGNTRDVGRLGRQYESCTRVVNIEIYHMVSRSGFLRLG